MTDRATLEARATKLGITFKDSWKDTTLANRIDAVEKASAEKAENATTADVTGATDVTGSTVENSEDQEQLKSGEIDAPQSTEQKRVELRAAVDALPDETLVVPEPTEITLVGFVDVTGPAKGRWRIGKHFTRQTQRIALADLKDGELDALEADPELAVTVVPTA